MMQLHKQIASVAGVGYIKGGGTVAAIIFCIAWFLLPVLNSLTFWQAAITTAIILIGTWSAEKVDAVWGKDSSKVVIDEVAGMAVTLLYAPPTIVNVILGLILFRFFDIVKPLGIRNLERIKGGIGVMADDILSGIYAFVVLRVIIVCQTHLFS